MIFLFLAYNTTSENMRRAVLIETPVFDFIYLSGRVEERTHRVSIALLGIKHQRRFLSSPEALKEFIYSKFISGSSVKFLLDIASCSCKLFITPVKATTQEGISVLLKSLLIAFSHTGRKEAVRNEWWK